MFVELPRLSDALENGMDLDAVIKIAKKATPETEEALIQRRVNLATGGKRAALKRAALEA